MKRIVMMVLRLGLLSVYYFIALCIKSNAEIKNFDKNFQWLRKVTTKVNKAGKVKIEASGMENLPKENGFVIFYVLKLKRKKDKGNIMDSHLILVCHKE